MPKSHSDFVDFSHVKQSVSIVQILEHYALTSKLRRNGDSFSGPCPLHDGENPTHFRVSISKNCWNCFGKCKRGGNILDFVALKESVSVRQAALLIQQWFGLQSPKHSDSGQAHSPVPRRKDAPAGAPENKADPKTANSPLTFTLQHLDKSHPYLAERGLTAETIDTFGLGYCQKGLLAGRIAIPIHNAAGQLVAYGGRWPGEPPENAPKYKVPQGFKKSLELFNLHRALKEAPGHPLVLVEGFFDVMRLWQHGIPRVMGLMGSSLSPTQEELIAKNTNPETRIILMLDEDDAGRKGREDALQRLATRAFVKVIRFENEGQQPEHLTADELQQLVGGVP